MSEKDAVLQHYSEAKGQWIDIGPCVLVREDRSLGPTREVERLTALRDDALRHKDADMAARYAFMLGEATAALRSAKRAPDEGIILYCKTEWPAVSAAYEADDPQRFRIQSTSEPVAFRGHLLSCTRNDDGSMRLAILPAGAAPLA